MKILDYAYELLSAHKNGASYSDVQAIAEGYELTDKVSSEEILEQYQELLADEVAYSDDSHISCKDCPDNECTGHCMSCAYRS